ncbi:hypothetical protein [Bosea sp. BIWAKO-01]|uniref:hypothetical protein n=1 Tax=Bosea sp. BIWAKO-01 TaxID=506668 RepID=UPI0008530F68|nr:hypothetical protein [Bosea sp. BIWAKO-01]GAU82898.1 hypothetical protein BIWAKO_02821 [Bosea sp. BIWAKO-01]
MQIEPAPEPTSSIVPNPMLLVFSDRDLDEIDVVCRIATDHRSDPTFTPDRGWFHTFMKSRKGGATPS